MERETVECMCSVAGSLQRIREKLKSSSPDLYIKVKEEIFDSLELMAIYCDTAPIRLIMGEVDNVMSDFETHKEEV